jgi:hypothetical protein
MSAASARTSHDAGLALAQRALTGVRATGVPLMLSLAVTIVGTGAAVIGLAPDVLGILAVVGFVATIVLAVVRARLVRPFLRASATRATLTPSAGLLWAVAVVIFIMAMIGAEGIGGHVGDTRQVSATVTSCYVDSKGAKICNGSWIYDGRSYSDELPGSGPVGSTQIIGIRPGQPGIALAESTGWLIAGIVLLTLDVGLATGWVFMLRRRSSKIVASAQHALAKAASG